MALRPGNEARVRAVEDESQKYAANADAVAESLADLARQVDSGEIDAQEAIPVEVLEESSVVNHVADLKATTRRVRRESAQYRRSTTYSLRRQIRR